jgi:outer membrane protein assembly factor BamB
VLAGGAARYGAWTPAPLPDVEGTWLQPSYDLGNTNHNPTATPPTADPELVWTYDVEGAVNALAVGVGHVFVGTEHAVYAFEDGAGHSRWDRAASGNVLAVSEDAVVAVGPRTVAAFAASSGEEWWRVSADWRLHGALADDRTVYVGLEDRVEAYALRSGRRRWTLRTGDESHVGFDGDRLLLSGSGVSAYEARGGLRGVLADAPARTWECDDVYMASTPVVADDHVLVGTNTCFRTRRCGVSVLSRDGDRERHVELGNGVSSVSTDGDRAYAVSILYGDSENGYNVPDSTTLHAIAPETGEEVWTFQRPGWFCPAVVADGTVYVGESGNRYGDGNLYALDAESGDRRWTYERPEGVHELAAVGDSLFVGTESGEVLELQ